MKKGLLIVLGMLSTAVCLGGCGNQDGIRAQDYITLGEYKGLSVTRISTDVTEEEVQAELDNMLIGSATTEEVTDRTDVQQGDVTNIDYTGTLDGEVFEGGSAQGFDLEIGSGRFIGGFEEGLIGTNVGDTATLNLKFPNEYPNNPDLAGKDVVFAVKVNSISKQVEPELNDAFIKEATGGEYATVDSYKAHLYEAIESSNLEYADSAMYTELWNQVVANAAIKKDIPQEYLQMKIDKMTENAKSYAEAYGMDFESFLTNYMGLDEVGFQEETSKYAETAAKESLVLQAIAKAENIEVTEEDLNQAVKEYVELYGYESEAAFRQDNDMDEFKEYILTSKVQEFLADQAIITVEE